MTFAQPIIPASAQIRPGQVLASSLLYAVAGLSLAPDLPLSLVVFFYLLLLYRVLILYLPRLAPGRLILMPLALVAPALVFHSYGTLVGQEGGTALLTLLLALKLLEGRNCRDLRLAVMLFPFWLISHFFFDQSPGIALFLGLLLILNLALLADLARPLVHSAPSSCISAIGGRGLLSPSGMQAFFSLVREPVTLVLRLTLQSLPLTLLLFVLFPRLDAPLWSFLPVEEVARSGINEWLEPGSVSELVLDGSLAFRVRFDGPVPAAEGLYWRGPVAWNTDGRRWSGGRPDQFAGLVSAVGQTGHAGQTLTYQVTLEPSRQRWLFALDWPVATPERDAVLTHDLQLLASKPIVETRTYRVISATSLLDPDLPAEQRAAGLALPDNITERMRELVATWQAQAGQPEELIQAGLRYFNAESFYYTLKPPRLGSNPADEFLFETRRGFCEHYASSFTLLMRLAGLPARIVMGYLGGERNPLGNHLIVRQSDAHAWVEVWLPGRGWTRVDPTAAVAPERVEPSPDLAGLASGRPLRLRIGGVGAWGQLLHGLRLFSDAVDEQWYRWVLGLDRSRQQALLERLGLGWLREYGLAGLMIMAAGVVLGFLMLLLRREPGRTATDPLDQFYRHFCTLMARAGWPRQLNEGPIDYGQRLVAVTPADMVERISSFTQRFARLRYGKGVADRKDLDLLRGDLRELKSGWRRHSAQRL
ncbi:MAG TPA: DUF3488 and transglutaminase-like domain-containing protein [Chromatiaceae bacterium]|nr:DUF3488 and transglutaminase-like domain-containing protein [Chromatiaceae bacterium]